MTTLPCPVAGAEFRMLTGAAGNPIRVAVAGSGPLVLMVHGFPELWYSWRHQIPAIAAAGFTAAAMDVRGYGGSAAMPRIEDYALRELAADIAAVIDQLGGGQAILIGHDWGAPQVYATAILHAEKIRAVVGLSTTPWRHTGRKPSLAWSEIYKDDFFYQRYIWPPGVAEAEIEADVPRFLRTFYYALAGDREGDVNPLWRPPHVRTLLQDLPDPDPLPAWLNAADVAYYAGEFQRRGMAGPLNRYRAVDLDAEQLSPFEQRNIDQPALFIGGARDPSRSMVPGAGDRYARPPAMFTDLRGGFHLLDGIGHWIQQEAPEAVNQRVIPFLQSIR